MADHHITDNTAEAADLIQRFSLERHPEGGYFRETYRSGEMIKESGLPARFAGDRSISTAIYFLLHGVEFSALHRIKSDEIWHFYSGSPLTIHVIEPDGRYSTVRLGTPADAGGVFQAVVRAGNWFGATLDYPTSYALAGCTVAPGFDFRDFEMGVREELLRLFPQHADLVRRLTRP